VHGRSQPSSVDAGRRSLLVLDDVGSASGGGPDGRPARHLPIWDRGTGTIAHRRVEEQAGMDPDLLRTVMSRVAATVTVVTASGAEGEPVGITVSAFTSVSADPPIVLFCIHDRAESLGVMLDAPGFTVNVLPEGSSDLAMLFATRGADKFGHTARHAPEYVDAGPVLDAAFAHFACRTIDRVEMGDHWVVFGQVESGSIDDRTVEPLVYLDREFGTVVTD
jgi:flavin reductase (DIM6/NTAB) family NADH-FMN oxidoreductase RutF